MKVSWQIEDKVRGVIAILVDDEVWKQGHRSILGFKPALPKECRSLDELHAAYTALELAGAKRYAYQRLALKAYSSFEMHKLLATKLVSAEIIDRVIGELQQLGYVNDVDWVMSFVRSQSNKRVGPQLIKAKLRQKGIPEDLVAQAMEDRDGESQKEGIEKLLATRYKSRDLSDYKERQKVIAALMRKGYNFETIKNVLP